MKKIYFLLITLSFFTVVNAQIINFPDAVFKAKLRGWGNVKDINGFDFVLDANYNNEIEISEALNVYEIVANGSSGGNVFSDATGIQYFTNAKKIDLSSNYLTNLNVSNLVNLQELKCIRNNIVNINLSGLTNLKRLECTNNRLTSLNLNNLNNLQLLYCSQNSISNLTISNLASLQEIYCGTFGGNISNGYEILNLSNLPSLTKLDGSTGSTTWGIDEVNLSTLNSLQIIDLSLTALLTIDVSMLPNIQSLDVFNCYSLQSIFAKNGVNEGISFGYATQANGSNLRYICADESQLNDVQFSINYPSYNVFNCHVNTYCSFTPGGVFYKIQGNSKFDNNNNGCDTLDIVYPNLKFNITNGTNSGSLISNITGNYSIPVQAGTHTITPVLENPTYFTASPSAVSVTFPTQASPITQNFCVTANGVHPDLELVVLPINRARPGFDATYKIICKNKGNTTQSGTVNLAFNDAVLDLVLANPAVTSQTVNNLSWAFSNLLPFETREILVTLNLNSPLETPAVNSGYVLNYTATITSAATDDLPNDNTFTYNQTVVNSFDPNDKTCLEGATITPSKVGDYVHYMIRFENNGTANAQNIVVKDMIDTAKFDINSIVPMKGSHSFVTNITTGNKVEFIFENINLPFDDANNDGYVAFKIKTKSTLVLGNTFTNNASIYFDYNFPIVTNTATTTIAALSVQDFEFSNYFSVYPNPVHDVLTISAKESIEVSSINIYNTLGQLVLVIPNAQNTKMVDVSSLTTGNYFIKINSDKGTSNTKFVKN
jgi:hypothetical protein